LANAKAHRETRQFNFQLNEKVQELRALLDLVRGLTSTLEPDEVARLLVLTLTGRWAVGKYALAVKKENHPPWRGRKGIALPEIESFAEMTGEQPEAVFTRNLPDAPFHALLAQKPNSFSDSLVESTNGILVLGSRLGKTAYTESDLEFGAGLVAQAGVALENSWYVLETIERKKMEQELALAASIQEGLFPGISAAALKVTIWQPKTVQLCNAAAIITTYCRLRNFRRRREILSVMRRRCFGQRLAGVAFDEQYAGDTARSARTSSDVGRTRFAHKRIAARDHAVEQIRHRDFI
jgi:hypothetical protein